MRFVIWLVILSISAVLTAWVTSSNHGHVTMFWTSYRIDLSMNLFLSISLVCFFGLFFLFRFIDTVINLPVRAKNYRLHQKELISAKALSTSIEHLFAGRYAKAIKFAEQAGLSSFVSDTSLMISAFASHRLKKYSERDHYLNKIKTSSSQQARLILQADMLVDDRDGKGALEIIQQLQEGGARQFLVQHIAMRAYQVEQKWPEMIQIAYSLTKRNYLPPLLGQARIHEGLTRWIQSGRIHQKVLKSLWDELNLLDTQQHIGLIKLFVQAFLEVGDTIQAKNILEAVLKKGLQTSLVELYPKCTSGMSDEKIKPIQLMQQVEQWLRLYPADPILNFALGKLCVMENLWGKAIANFVVVIGAPRAEIAIQLQAHLELSKIYATIDDLEKSLAHQQDYLRLVS
ncbi:MAG: heme biosynthesis HemY N-terminal domain-containing protein [Betaproteobacteria bacterium]|jgi:HemY protein